MDFYLKKGNDELRNSIKGYKKFKDNNFYVLFTTGEISGYAAFDIKKGYANIYDIRCDVSDERIFDALLRAVAFYATENMIQYTVYDGEDENIRNRALKSILIPYEDKNMIRAIFEDAKIDKNKGLFVDGVWLFSQKCKGDKMNDK